MELSSHLAAILGVIILLKLYSLWKQKSYRHKIKGQKLAPEASGGLPIIGHVHLLGGPKTLSRTLGDMADKHGPVFTIRLGVHRAVIISSYDTMKECFTTNDKILSSRPPSSQAKYLGYNYAAFGFAPSGSYWRNVRKLAMVELLSSHRIKALKHFYEDEVSDMIKDLYSQCKGSSNNGGPVKFVISEWLENLVLNIITRMIAGKRFFDGSNVEGNDEEGRPIGKILREFMYIMGVMAPSDLVPFLGWMDNFGGPVKTMKRLFKEIDAIMENWIEEHKDVDRIRGDAKGKQDFIDVMLSTIQDDATFGHPRETIIKATAMTFIVAGSDTTSITLTWILSNLMNNRRALELTQEELDKKVGKDRLVQESDIEHLVYLQAVIKETLRLYPPGPVAVPREANDDCFIGGYFIPKGTRFFSNLWKLQRDPNAWKNPEEFIPERFLTTNKSLDVLGQHFEYIPFGSGRRACPGLNFAMQVMHLTLARLLQAFNWTTPMNQPVDMTEGLGLSLPKATPLDVMLTPRLAPEFYRC